jgi:hypothetical protein
MHKLPRRAVPKDLALSGHVTLRYPTLSVKVSDGHVIIKGWKNFIEQMGWEVSMKIVMLFCGCDDKAWLFVNHLDAEE